VPPDDGADFAARHDRREQRFRNLYQRHYELIRAYALRRTWSPEDAADVVAETFTVAWRRIGEVPACPADRLWLYGVARKVISGRHRSAGRQRNLLIRLISTAPPGSQLAPAADPAKATLLEALSRLRPADREALQLVVWDELSQAEAAEVLGCSANAVGIRVHRAKARLRADLAGRIADAPLSNHRNG
jgi:RNA polymerase sigma-70 factor (ECF subfamily)